VKRIGLLLIAAACMPATVIAQGLREVPRQFVYVEPVGLLLGFGSVGLERTVGRHTTVNFAGIGVYSEKDGIRIYGGGLGVGVRRYFGGGEAAGLAVGTRVDGLWLIGDNRNSTNQFLGTTLPEKTDSPYLGINLFTGYRIVSRSGVFFEPTVGYEFLVGPTPLVAGSRQMQREMGFSAGLMMGMAW